MTATQPGRPELAWRGRQGGQEKGDREEDGGVIDHGERGKKRADVEVLGTMLYLAIQCGSEDWKETGGGKSHRRRKNVKSILKWRTPGDGRMKDRCGRNRTRFSV
jgi:hypothetical protein